MIPLAFLSPPQYTWSAPKYINYATIALTIAHEALHALDGSGMLTLRASSLVHYYFLELAEAHSGFGAIAGVGAAVQLISILTTCIPCILFL